MWDRSQSWKGVRRGGALAFVVAALAVSQMSSTAAEGPYPGLPPGGPGHIQWGGVAQTGMTEAVKTRQFARLPLQAMAADMSVGSTPMGPTPECPASDGSITKIVTTNVVYFVSPQDSEMNYGLSVPMTVRTVGFGAIPVEAVVQIEQPRDATGMLKGLDMTQSDWGSCGEGGKSWRFYSDAPVTSDIHVRVTDVVVDGEDLGLRAGCRTPSSRLELLGKGGRSDRDMFMDPEDDLPQDLGPNSIEGYGAGNGGRLTGTVDIGAFAGCVTASGEDISVLLTGMISGPGNPVTVQVGGNQCGNALPGGGIGPPPPGSVDPVAANCPASATPDELPYPTHSDG